ncbi:MAG TPA: hypothetical protein DEH78_28555, partial [Solibacterales bacterium]|nr:hypothetical protein [Bryobacterales bacterium]
MRFLLFLATAGVLSAQYWTSMFPPVRGTREMVGAANNQEVEAGYRILTQGGNAVDAGVAAVLAAGVTEQSRFGLGGEMPLILKMAGKPPVVISGVGTAPAKATVEFYRTRKPQPWEEPGRMPPIPSEGLLAAVVPGVIDGLLLALKEHGTMSFAQVAAPAIENAEGFPIQEEFAGMLGSYRKIFQFWPVSEKFFYPSGAAPRRGDIVKMPDLAQTLKAMVQAEKKARGNRVKKLEAVRDYFYRGPVAKRIGEFSQANGGLLAYEDMAGFRAEP